MKRFLCILFLLVGTVYSTEKPKSVIAIDLGWSTEGLSNEGYGFGLSLEQELFSFMSIKLRHGVVETYKNRVGNRVDSFIYVFLLAYNPFNKGLEGPSLALGYGYDNVLVSDHDSGETKYNFLINFIDTYVSYKFILAERFLLEPYVEFLWPMADVNRLKTGIAMDTTYVNIIGLNLGFVF
ncbi:MAG: hypothetical protein N2258_01690 [Brevinematales bacterium]|nr:hypothetical protein [Brevinematales bacterium]